MMLSLNMVDYLIPFILLFTWFFCQTSRDQVKTLYAKRYFVAGMGCPWDFNVHLGEIGFCGKVVYLRSPIKVSWFFPSKIYLHLAKNINKFMIVVLFDCLSGRGSFREPTKFHLFIKGIHCSNRWASFKGADNIVSQTLPCHWRCQHFHWV